ncbi:MAG: sigma-70 family RNA polymerase sigma factor [Ruminococcaceae bacterium]|nr:sigma-70 family RNA polymerase sigma factor [Oscillospiraceae bacterium]
MSFERCNPTAEQELLDRLVGRDESALSEVSDRWGRMLYGLAYRITGSVPDAEECVNDALLDLWQNPPAHGDTDLSAYVSVLVRRRAVDRVRFNTANRRGGGDYTCALDELDQCLADPNGQADEDSMAIRDALQAFLDSLDKENRVIFLLRYYAAYSNAEIARRRGIGERAVEMRLNRMRKRLRRVLAEHDVSL